MEEESLRRNHGGIMEEESWRRNLGRVINLGGIWRQLGDILEASGRLPEAPRGIQKTPRRHPGSTQEGPRKAPRAPRAPEASERDK